MKLNISVSSKFNPDRYVWYKLKKDIEVYQNELHKKDIVGLDYRDGSYIFVRKTEPNVNNVIPHHDYNSIAWSSNVVDYTTGKKLDKAQIREEFERYNKMYRERQ